MPVISLKYKNPQIMLIVKGALIAKYHLEQFVNEVINPTVTIDFTNFNEVQLPFSLPNFKGYDMEFLTQFIDLFEHALEENQLKNHCDDLLCLAHIYNQTYKEKKINFFNDKYYKSRGKLLLNLIKAPLPKYTLKTIGKAFEDDDLSPEEIEDYLLMYLGVESKSKEKEFKDADGKLDYSKVSKELENKIIKRVLIDRNISIKMPNGNSMIISNEISAMFSYKMSNEIFYFSSEDRLQNNIIIKTIISSLFEQQEKDNPQFYQAILEHDFLSNDYNKLSNTFGRWESSNHSDYILDLLHITIMQYLTDEGLLLSSSNSVTKRIRNNFIYKYFILLGLTLNSEGKLTEYHSIDQIKLQLDQFTKSKKSNPNFATQKFHNRHSNTNR